MNSITHKCRFEVLDRYPEVCCVVTNSGRVGEEVFGNMSLSPEHTDKNVPQNRRNAAKILGIPLERSVFMRQAHSANILAVDACDGGRGAFDYFEAPAETDALITRTPNLALYALAADCQPILLYDPATQAIAAVHCGWRGTIQHLPKLVVEALKKGFGADAKNLVAALGPCIGPGAFEVRGDAIALFKAHLPDVPLLPHPNPEQAYIDLPQANKGLLVQAGLREENIEICNLCTHSTWPFFYSARKGDTGRFAMAIARREE